jgi:hypothetical protein
MGYKHHFPVGHETVTNKICTVTKIINVYFILKNIIFNFCSQSSVGTKDPTDFSKFHEWNINNIFSTALLLCFVT